VSLDQAREKYIRIGEMGKALREEKIESLNR
jgi:aspartate aminotransferase-like enzyme